MKKLQLLFIIGFIFFFNESTRAQVLKGTWGYSYIGNQMCVYGDKITNENDNGCTGTLKIALYATDTPYCGGTINGYCLFEKKLDGLTSGYSYNNLDFRDKFVCPPNGYYYMTILLLEYKYTGGYKIVDYVSMDNVVWFGD